MAIYSRLASLKLTVEPSYGGLGEATQALQEQGWCFMLTKIDDIRRFRINDGLKIYFSDDMSVVVFSNALNLPYIHIPYHETHCPPHGS